MTDDPAHTDAAGFQPVGAASDGLRRRFEAIVTEADEGVIVLDPSGSITYANPAAEFLLGHSSRELRGEMFGMPIAEQDKPVTINVVSGDGAVRTGELRIERLGGDAQGAVVVRVRDITAHSQTIAEARDEVRRRDEFLAMLSHELRNPLAAIQNASQLLAREDLLAPFRQEAAEVVERQFQHLSRILDDLLDVTRILRGKLTISPQRVDLNRVLRDAVEAATPLITRRSHALRVALPAQSLQVWGDPTRLEQIAVNLLNNAAKFTPAGGSLALTAQVQGDEVELCITDNGPGIADEMLERIFDSFVQGPQNIDRSEGGLGIGLMLVRTFAALHNGRVEVHNNSPDPGATFTVHLPLLKPTGDTAPSSAGAVDRQQQPLRVLLVEDSQDSRKMLKLLLQSEGHGVLEAATGPEGVAAIVQHQPDVAIVDIGLPGLNGYEVAREVHRVAGPHLPTLVALTGYGTPDDLKKALDAGFHSHMVKPVRFHELRDFLRKCRADRELTPHDGCPDAADSTPNESGGAAE
jgi:signal transduction histidine kinase/ActR/RegA family two-component response regulator